MYIFGVVWISYARRHNPELRLLFSSILLLFCVVLFMFLLARIGLAAGIH